MIVVDDENADIEGNIIMAASLTSPRDIAFMIKHGSGIVSVGMKEEDLDRLKLPLMSKNTEYVDSSAPTFTITVVMFCNLWLYLQSHEYDLKHLDRPKVHFKPDIFCLFRMQKLAHLLGYLHQTGQRQFLLFHLQSLNQKTFEGQAMSFPSSIEMVGF